MISLATFYSRVNYKAFSSWHMAEVIQLKQRRDRLHSYQEDVKVVAYPRGIRSWSGTGAASRCCFVLYHGAIMFNWFESERNLLYYGGIYCKCIGERLTLPSLATDSLLPIWVCFKCVCNAGILFPVSYEKFGTDSQHYCYITNLATSCTERKPSP